MPPPYQRHVFICINRRPDESPKGSCAAKGSEDLPPLFKKAIDARGITGVRINKSQCLDACERACAVVVYPEQVWYEKVTAGDVDEIVSEHLLNGRPVERLKMAPYLKKAK